MKTKEVISAAVPVQVKEALAKALKRGITVSESDYVRSALVKKLKEDGLL